MKSFSLKPIIIFLLLLTSGNLFSQTDLKINASYNLFRINRSGLSRTGSNTDAYLFIGSIVVLTLTPTVVYENKKFYFGLGREFSLAFGKHGEFRISGEYTYIFRSASKSYIRASFKYDVLSKLTGASGLTNGNLFRSVRVIIPILKTTELPRKYQRLNKNRSRWRYLFYILTQSSATRLCLRNKLLIIQISRWD